MRVFGRVGTRLVVVPLKDPELGVVVGVVAWLPVDPETPVLSLSSSFRLMVGQGYSDLVIPFGVSKYVLDHMPSAFADRVALKLYRGGHMFYTRPTSREQFTTDAKAFFAPQPPAAPAVKSN